MRQFFEMLKIEYREMFKSITFYVVILCIIVFFFLQFGTESMSRPQKNQDSYGSEYSFDHKIIMEQSLEQIMENMKHDYFVTYPIGFYKEVKLSKVQKKEIYKILDSIVVNNQEKTNSKTKRNSKLRLDEDIPVQSVQVKEGISYDLFCEKFDQIDKILGGGSTYYHSRLFQNTSVEISYEKAKKNYDDFILKDRVSGAYARIFCDYMGIILAIMPVFLAVTRMLKDKRAKALEVIYAKEISSAKLIISRYVAMVTLFFAVILLVSLHPFLQSIYIAKVNNVSVDFFAFFRYSFLWLFPIVLFVVSFSFFITEWIGGIVAMISMMAFWIVNLFSVSNVEGTIGWNFVLRFNQFGNYQLFKHMLGRFMINRFVYFLLAMIFLGLTIFLYAKKRRNGGIKIETTFLHRKRVS